MGSEAHGETLRRNFAGDTRNIRVLRRPYVDKTGEIAGIVTVAVDTTEQQKAEQEAKLHRDNLEALVEERTDQLVSAQTSLLRQERLAALGQLTATVSHELRNPLATISQSASLLRRHAPDSDDQIDRNLDRIDRSIHRYVAIIEQLLSFGQVQRERQTQRLALDRWLGTVLETYEWAPGVEHVIDLTARTGSKSTSAMGSTDACVARLSGNPHLPRKICFEITETAAITNLARASRFMLELKDLGCRFALDDFGTGLSSYTYLKQLPVDFLKIDGSFVRDIVDSPIDFAMVKSINEIGHALGKTTVAEFVENDAILTKLAQIGVDYVQGYFVGPPLPIPTSPKPD
jgi:EAL domain-containing protein (putative c-di-GMP-specific phosphodiesterase class I)